MSGGSDNANTIEVFLKCKNLTDPNEKPYDTFAVIMFKPTATSPFEELERTETLSNTSNPQFCTSFQIPSPETSTPSPFSPQLRFDIYERKTVDTERLRDHLHRGTAGASVEDLMTARGNHLSLLLHHPRDPRDVGTVSVYAEEVDVSNRDNASIVQVDVTTSILRRRDWNKTLLAQRYELYRAHRYDDEDGNTVWLPVYRSDRMMKQRDNPTHLDFSTASITHRHLCNADEERVMRLALYGMPQAIGGKTGGGNKRRETLLAYTNFTLRFVCEIDPTEEVLGLEGKEGEEEEDLGNVSIMRAEPTDYGSHFSFRVNFEHTAKYTSAGSEEKKRVAKKMRRLTFARSHKKSASAAENGTSLSELSLMNGLFKSEDSGEKSEQSGEQERNDELESQEA